jgi:hypothetical protein
MSDFLDRVRRMDELDAESVQRKLLAYSDHGIEACHRFFVESGLRSYLEAASAYGRASSLAMSNQLELAAQELILALEAHRTASQEHQEGLLRELWPYRDIQTKIYS